MSLFEQIESQLDGQPGQPPLASWAPPLSGDIDIRISANGEWFHEGSLMQRHSLVELFASILRKEEDGEYYLVTPVEKWRITVEDAPLLIIDMDAGKVGTPNQNLIFTSNVSRLYPLGSDYPLSVEYPSQQAEPSPYLQLDHGLTAKLTRSVYYRLVDLAEESAGRLRVLSDGVYFDLGSLEGAE